MEAKFNFKSAVCTSRSQSKRLLALGLKKETADMALHFSYVDCEGNAYYSAYPIGHQCTAIPAWSLHRLMSMLTAKRKCLLIRFEADLYDVLINRIEHEIKEGYFNKEYLEE